MDRYRKRADHNWWAAIKAFATEDEVKSAVMNDPRHVHLLVFVAPGWCSWSQKQLKELQENFDDFGEAADRVHLIDVDVLPLSPRSLWCKATTFWERPMVSRTLIRCTILPLSTQR